jgi:hypothetical protein
MNIRRAVLVSLVLLAIVPAALAQSGNQCIAPRLIAPANGSVNVIPSPITWQWTKSEGSYGYTLYASHNGAAFEPIGNTTATDFQNGQPFGTKISWYVESAYDTCKPRSETFTFTTASCETSVARLNTPADHTTINSPVTFSWDPVESAEFFRLWIAEEVGDELEYSVLETTWRTETTVRVPPGTYAWFIETIFECDSTVSDVNVFTIIKNPNCSAAKPVLVAPAPGATVTSPVVFRWNPVPGAIGYQVWAALDDGDYEFVDETEADRTTTRVYVGDGTVKWIVIAQFNGCDDTTSDPGTFVIPFNPQCDNSAPFPIAPRFGASNVPTKVDFIWTPVAKAIFYNVWVHSEEGGGDDEGGGDRIVGTTPNTRLSATLPGGESRWWVEANFADCPPESSPTSLFEVNADTTCREPIAPAVFVDPEALTGNEYLVIWSPGPNTASYEVQEATTEDFSNATTRVTQDTVLGFHHSVTQRTRYFYRVRSTSSCGLGFGPYSATASLVIAPNETLSAEDAELTSSYGAQTVVVQKVKIPGSGVGVGGATEQFTATTDKPWLTVEPASGLLPPEGLEVTVSADPRTLPVGTNTATIKINTTTSDGSKQVPVSINLVTPVSPTPSNSPTSESLIIPAIAHATGVGAKFESDVRVANASAQVMTYLLNFTPSNTDGSKNGRQATIQVDPGETAALNDILANFYGFATGTDNISGVLEIRPVQANTASGLPADSAGRVTFASSRTYATTPNGTYGQFVPAIPYSDFIARNGVISLQQVAKSVDYRTNIGLVEGSGEGAKVLVTIFDQLGRNIQEIVKDLLPGQHTQFPMEPNVDNGRIEVRVLEGSGRVTAYASVLDNKTADPLLVMPVVPAQSSNSRFILPGIADLNTGSASWRSDIRLYNAGSTPVSAQLQYYAQNDPANARTIVRTIQPGQVDVIDSALQTLYSMSNSGGSVVVTTAGATNLIASARTYNQTANGTYGQFIPAVTTGEGVGAGERALQILQVEESERFRTNLGIFELTGNPVTVEISATAPDSRVSAKATRDLAPNQFLQIGGILTNLGLPTTYNARITLRVIGGTGRISGYASLIDNRTQDPTYVPAQ